MRAALRPLGALLSACLFASCGQAGTSPAPEAPPAARVVGETPLLRLPAPVDGRVVTFAVWGSRELPAGVLRTALRDHGVIAASEAAAGTLDLQGVSGATKPLPRRSGHVLPISALALSPDPLIHDRNLSRVARALARGDAAMGAATAGLRGMGSGDGLLLGTERRSVSLTVGPLLDESALLDQEIVLPLSQARSLGLRTRAVVVAAYPDHAQRVARALLAAAGDTKARIRPLQGDAAGAPVLPLSKVKELFGEFSYRPGRGDAIVPDPRWVRWAILSWRMPVIGTVRCHRNLIPQLYYALAEIDEKGLAHLIESYDGCYVPRMMRSNGNMLSRHAFGIAIDLNAADNGMGAVPTIDHRIVEIMERWGFVWGGRFSVPDGMHFEFGRYPQ